MALKINGKWFEKLIKKIIDFKWFFEQKWLPNGRPGRLKKELKREPESKQKGRHQNGAKMSPKWSQNGAKTEPKWSQNEQKTIKF